MAVDWRHRSVHVRLRVRLTVPELDCLRRLIGLFLVAVSAVNIVAALRREAYNPRAGRGQTQANKAQTDESTKGLSFCEALGRWFENAIKANKVCSSLCSRVV